jgi:hypothetical protein
VQNANMKRDMDVVKAVLKAVEALDNGGIGGTSI